MSIRSIAEKLSRNRSMWRRLPRAFGSRPMLVSPDASLRWFGRNPFEKSLLQLAETVSAGQLVWDVGANVGAFALPTAHREAEVLAIEADPFLANLLTRTSAANDDVAMHVLCAAVGNKIGIANFAIAGRGRASSGLVDGHISSQHGHTRKIIGVPTVTLDQLLDFHSPPDLIKIDVEGAELLVLEGAGKILREVRPRMYIEVVNQTRSSVQKLLTDTGYRFEGHDNLLAVPL